MHDDRPEFYPLVLLHVPCEFNRKQNDWTSSCTSSWTSPCTSSLTSSCASSCTSSWTSSCTSPVLQLYCTSASPVLHLCFILVLISHPSSLHANHENDDRQASFKCSWSTVKLGKKRLLRRRWWWRLLRPRRRRRWCGRLFGRERGYGSAPLRCGRRRWMLSIPLVRTAVGVRGRIIPENVVFLDISKMRSGRTNHQRVARHSRYAWRVGRGKVPLWLTGSIECRRAHKVWSCRNISASQVRTALFSEAARRHSSRLDCRSRFDDRSHVFCLVNMWPIRSSRVRPGSQSGASGPTMRRLWSENSRLSSRMLFNLRINSP